MNRDLDGFSSSQFSISEAGFCGLCCFALVWFLTNAK